MSLVLRIYQKCEKLPFGKRIFSKLLCLKAPYFGSIKPVFVELQQGYCEITMKKRHSVQNHLKTVHAAAMCNICELAGGTLMDVTVPGNMRWIPRSMNIEYLKMAKTGLRAKCELSDTDLNEAKDVPVIVHVTDHNEVEVVRAVIQMYIKPKK